MQFLRTLFWALLVGLLVAFSFNNWTTIDVRLWGGIIQINLPLLLGIVFLAGFLPIYLAHRASRWRTRSKIAALERTIADLRLAQSLPAAPPPPAPTPPGELPLEPAAEPRR